MADAVPQLEMGGMPAQTPDGQAPPTPHLKSGRRLSKSVMRSDSQDAEGSKAHGMAVVRDGSGTERAIRVVQKAEAEDFNMMKVTWVWQDNGKTFQVDLRHGRKSGIRKVYVNKELIERVKNLKDMVSDSGSRHEFLIDGRVDAEIRIVPKSMTGFTYQLLIGGNAIEQSVCGPMQHGPLDIGTRPIQLPKTEAGLGMTLRNNPLGTTGVVVWTVEPGKAAEEAGIKIGDVVLSVEDYIVSTIDNLAEYVAQSQGVVNMEVAGTASSRVIHLSKLRPPGDSGDPSKPFPIGLGLQTTSCGVGILVTEIDTGSAASLSELVLGDTVLSIEDTVPVSPKHAVSLILGAVDSIKFVVIGNATPELS